MQFIKNYHQSTGLRRVLIGGVSVFIVLILLVIGYVRHMKRIHDLTTLRVQTEKQKVEAQKVLHELTVSNDRERLKVLSGQFQDLQHRIDYNTRKIKDIEVKADSDMKQIEALKSWNDLDVYNKSRR